MEPKTILEKIKKLKERKDLKQISAKEEKILKMKNGLDGYEPHTLGEIAKEYGVSRERIRQLEAKALDYLSQLDQ